mmetsp:Transcript_8623/g.11407  ORF Transcript_8623/g.11407 Transcript_8623/m.11407 type:complete len:251 (-) Transcript_8623:282-1034(-)
MVNSISSSSPRENKMADTSEMKKVPEELLPAEEGSDNTSQTSASVDSARVEEAESSSDLGDVDVVNCPPQPEDNGSSSNTLSCQRKSVRFGQIVIREHGVTLGDHPGTGLGPPLTIEWKHQAEHVLPVDDYEKAHGDFPRHRKGRELLMPGSLRFKMLKEEHSPQEIRKAQREAGRIRSNRCLCAATTDIERYEVVWQSAIRKFNRWRKRQTGAELEPAEKWIEEFKKVTVGEDAASIPKSPCALSQIQS